MGSMKINGMEEFELALSRLAAGTDRVAQKALREAAKPVADRVRRNLENLQEDFMLDPSAPYHYLPDGSHYTGVPAQQKADLLEALGVTNVRVNNRGDWDIKIGFDGSGYDSQRTRTYPRGRPLLMLARSIEHGSSIQPKQPFFRKAVEATKKQAVEIMNRIITEETEKVVK